ncbi:membrane-bound lytic murein transglycosylase MltF [Fontimonas sp. SYSU GA230001]|uniref:membrane-bound lytic murein transglycosylase MltF n=1 Tax=Fontimonas sp. SYSU GA230001 TaxID=3142450 RepID=UPI0032B4EAD9
MNPTAMPILSWSFARRLLRLGPLALVAGWLALVSTCSPRETLLTEVRSLGVLRIATINSPTSYYIGSNGEPTGFEYDLAAGFARHLGVTLDIRVAANPPEAAQLVLAGEAHLAAAGLAATDARRSRFRFTRPLQSVVPLLVYRKGARRPSGLGELSGTLRVVAGSAHAELLHRLREASFPHLQWEETAEQESEELLLAVSGGDLDYTIANSNLVAINQRYYPNLATAFAIADAQPLAWAFSAQRDDSLLRAAESYFDQLGAAELSRIHDRYFGHIEQVDSLGALTLATHVDTRLPRYRAAFEKAAEVTGLDWRLLAAIGYQESHWDPNAVSPTGVRGIMQLTAATAELMSLSNREDPAQSILGGSRYFRMLLDRLPPEIVEPDRTWLALIAYNIGYGHLLDVRQLTAQQGGDPNRWLDVRDRLPLLTQSKWYSRLRYGYARGHEARTYVGNVRTYYDMLVWLTGVPAQPPAPSSAAPEERPPPSKETSDPLRIDSPIL